MPIIPLNNEAEVVEAGQGLFTLNCHVWTRIANKKRHKVFCELALRALTDLEATVADLPYEEIELLVINSAPISGTNGNEKAQLAETPE